jgi:membrane protein DedA with SNARE-associated domain
MPLSFRAGTHPRPPSRFALLTLLGCIPWVLAWAVLGEVVGLNWTRWKDHLVYADYAVLAVAAAGACWLIVPWRRAGTQAAG